MTSNCAINASNPVLQMKSSSFSGSTLIQSIAAISSPPDQTKGTEVLTVTLTPRNATNLLVVDFSTFGPGGDWLIAALFQDASNALCVAYADTYPSGTPGMTVHLHHVLVAGTTSPTTIKIRCGGANRSGYIGTDNSYNTVYGGVAATTLIVKELKA